MSVNILKSLEVIRFALQPVQSQPAMLKLQDIEQRIPLLKRVDSPDFKVRVALLRELCCQRMDDLFSKIQRPHRPQPSLAYLEETKQKLIALKQKALSPQADYRADLAAIPPSYREWLYWAVWIKDGCPNATQYGEKTIWGKREVLLAQDPVICLKGESLIDQLICYVDQKLALKKQKLLVQTLEVIADRLKKPPITFSNIIAEIESLPSELQVKMYSQVLSGTSLQPKDLPQHPQLLHKLSSGSFPTPLQCLLLEAKNLYKNLQSSAELEEFERISILYSSANEKQRNELLKWISPKARKWILELEVLEMGMTNTSSLYRKRGAHVQEKETAFCVFAPHAKKVSLILTAFGHEEDRIPMQKDADGTWKISTEKAPAGRSYRYLIEDQQGRSVFRTDPFSFSTIDCGKWLESKVSAVDHFQWGDTQWMQEREIGNPLKKPLSVYELYAESWKKKDGKPIPYRELADELIAYCKKTHFSHVELYGILDNRGGWGYQVHNFFAPNHRLGTAEDFQYLVDKLHQNGIGVILDWIPAHYKHQPEESTLHNFDGTNLFSSRSSDWGTMFFDFSKEESKRLLKASALYWLDIMHIDAIRIDAVSHIVKHYGNGFPSYGVENPEGIAFLKDLNKTVFERFPGVLMIAEDPSNFPRMTTSLEEGGLGFHLKWGINEGQKIRWFLQTPSKDRPKQHHDKFMDHLHHVKNKDKMMITHSHDEMANRNARSNFPPEKDQTLYKIDTHTNIPEKFADMRNLLSWQILAPSRGYLLHMGDEIGQKRSWDATIWSKEGSIEWNLLDPNKEKECAHHLGLQSWISDLNRLYQEVPAFRRGEQGFRLCSDHPANNVIAYERCEKNASGIIVVHNFSNGSWTNYDISLGKSEKLKNVKVILNSDDPKYAGQGKYPQEEVKMIRDGNSTRLLLALPPLSTLVLEKIT